MNDVRTKLEATAFSTELAAKVFTGSQPHEVIMKRPHLEELLAQAFVAGMRRGEVNGVASATRRETPAEDIGGVAV